MPTEKALICWPGVCSWVTSPLPCSGASPP
jgi:hypothetical protein